MLRKKSKAVPERNDYIPMLGGITLEELRRVMSETMGEAFEEIKEDLRRMDQRLASLEQDARQPRLAMEVDVPADNKTREHTEGAATAVQVNCGGSCSAKKVLPGPKILTSFGMKAEPLAFPHRDDVLVENGAAAPKSCLSPLEMRTLTAAGDLLPTGTTCTATRTTFDQPPLWFCPTEETNLRT